MSFLSTICTVKGNARDLLYDVSILFIGHKIF